MLQGFTHMAEGGTQYVSSEAQQAAGAATGEVPTHLAAVLLVAGLGLYLLKRAGFRFVVSAKTGF